VNREPGFENLLKVLRREKPDRPTLFELFLNGPLYERITAKTLGVEGKDWIWGSVNPVVIEAFQITGYDYVTVLGSDMKFEAGVTEKKATVSLNAGNVIHDRESFKAYQWPDPDKYDYSRLESAKGKLPAGMKLIVLGPCGVLENVIFLVGFERLCMMLADDADLVKDIFDAVGSRLVRYYEICADFDTVGALIANDDWGFKTATMFSPADLRRYVFGWYKKIVTAFTKQASQRYCIPAAILTGLWTTSSTI
jgi:uroporphyrinogen decarboxylase